MTGLLASGAVLGSVQAGPASAEPAGGATTLWAAFETGTTSAWSEAPNVTLGQSFAHSGDFGAEAVSTPNDLGYLRWDASAVAQGMRYARLQGWVRVTKATPGESVGIVAVKNNAGSKHFDLFRDPSTGKWRWDLYRHDDAYSTMDATVGNWYHLEALIDYGGVGGTTYTAQVRINGIDQPSIESTDVEGSTVRSAWFGGGDWDQTNTRDYDGLILDVGDTPFSFDD